MKSGGVKEGNGWAAGPASVNVFLLGLGRGAPRGGGCGGPLRVRRARPLYRLFSVGLAVVVGQHSLPSAVSFSNHEGRSAGPPSYSKSSLPPSLAVGSAFGLNVLATCLTCSTFVLWGNFPDLIPSSTH